MGHRETDGSETHVTTALKARFTEALDAFVASVEHDRSVLAAILCGSLSHDAVWEKSDIDLVLVTIDDRKAERSNVALNLDGINAHVWMLTRAEFRKSMESARHNSFVHSLMAKGRLLYTHDDTIARIMGDLTSLGKRDAELQMFNAACAVLPPLYKAHKWIVTRGDLDYTALWILYAATPLAQLEVLRAGQLVDREVLPQARAINPALFDVVYTRLLNAKKTAANIEQALGAIDAYLVEHTPTLFAPLFEYLEREGEARSATEIEDHFKRHFGLGGVTTACEYLADRALIAKVSTPVQLTRRSNVTVEELAFMARSDRALR